MNRILIVEDESSISETLADFFGGRGWEVTAVASAEEAEEQRTESGFEMILLDLLLPGKDGLTWLRELRSGNDATPVIVLTARGEEAQRIEGLRLGADDYLVKPFSVHELEARIEAVQRRTGDRPSRVRIGEAEVDLEGFEIVRNGERHALVQKEAELLAFLVQNPGRTFRRDELLRSVWGYDATPTTRTIDTHVCNLRRKIETSPDEPQHLVTVHGVGYRLVL